MTYKMKCLLVVCLMVMASTCMAMTQQQQPDNCCNAADGQRKRPNMEQLTKTQATRISQSLGLDDKTSRKFIETFCQCRKEMAATRPHRQGKKRAEMTDSEVDKAIRADFAQGRKLLDIREKYYKAYSKFLTPKQIQRVYDMERQDMQRFAKRWQARDRMANARKNNAGKRQNVPRKAGQYKQNTGDDSK